MITFDRLYTFCLMMLIFQWMDSLESGSLLNPALQAADQVSGWQIEHVIHQDHKMVAETALAQLSGIWRVCCNHAQVGGD